MVEILVQRGMYSVMDAAHVVVNILDQGKLPCIGIGDAMTSRCNICVDPNCDGRQDCNCDTCDKKDCCYRFLAPTIRITTKCTQSCEHCCFSCSPERNEFMSLEQAQHVGRFLKANDIWYANIMGGEFFMHPDWFDIISAICEHVDVVRLVTNGDWVTSKSQDVKVLAEKFPIKIAISKDRWHTNNNVVAASEFCEASGIPYKVATEEETKEESVVPVGNAQFEYNLYSSLMRYCGKPDRKYNFLINEQGEISKCPFGAWEYANVSEYLDGGFDKRFKHFTGVFYSEFIPNCTTCLRIWERENR